MIFQRDDFAPPRYTREVKNFSNQTYWCWIGRDGKATKDLTPLDSFLWGRNEERVYKDYWEIHLYNDVSVAIY